MSTVELRDAVIDDAPAIARVYVETWRATYRGILPHTFLDGMSEQRLARSWSRSIARGDEVVLVAERDGAVVAFASAGREKDADPFLRGELFTLYVQPRAQRGGVGGTLLFEALDRMHARDLVPAIVWVLEKNEGARRFYEVHGGVPVRRDSEVVGGVRVAKVGYAFFDTDDAGLIDDDA